MLKRTDYRLKLSDLIKSRAIPHPIKRQDRRELIEGFSRDKASGTRDTV